MRFEAQTSSVKIVGALATVFGLATAILVAQSIGQGQYFTLVVLAIVSAGLIWTIGGLRIWWFPIFFLPALGGMFFMGFKIYVHELAVLICMFPLVTALATNKQSLIPRRTHMRGLVVILLLYLCVHLLCCLGFNKFMGYGGMGNVLRRYADALWPIMFLLPFLFFGNTGLIKWSLRLMLAGYLIRYVIDLYAGLSGREEIMYIPLINYLPPSGGSIGDLRVTGSMVAVLGIIYLCLSKGFLSRAFNILLILIGCWGTLLGGNRMALVSLAFIVVFACMIYRRYGLILLCAAIGITGLGILNSDPNLLYSMPPSVRRSASGLIYNRSLGADLGDTAPSDEWHFRLMKEGWNNWTENAFTILFGRGTRQFEEAAWESGSGDVKFEGMIEMATATGRYEKGLWDTLCTFGIVGFAIHIAVIWMIIRDCGRAVFRYKIKNHTLGLAFMALSQCLSWILLCWITGGFPSFQIMLGLVAKVALDDMKREDQAAKPKEADVTEIKTPQLGVLPMAKSV